MSRLSRYLFVECALSSITALMVLTFLIMLPQVLHLVDLWVNKGVSVGILGKMTLLSIPKFVVASLPMAMLVGILLALGRLAQDSEIVVLKACGLSLYQILRPIAILVTLFSGFSLFLNTVWTPHSFHLFSVLKNALISANTLSLKAQTFNQTIPGLIFYVHEQDPGGREMRGILIHDRRKPDQVVTLTARIGRLYTTPDGSTGLVLTDGSQHQKMRNGQYRQLVFGTYDLDLGVSLGLKPQHKKEQLDELSMSELKALIDNGKESKLFYEARMEWHRRLAYPTATLILGLFAVPLGLQHSHRSGRSYGFVVAVVTLILHFMLLSTGEAMAQKQIVSPLSGFWLPNLLMALLTGYVMFATAQGRAIKAAIWLTQFMSLMPQKLLRAAPPGGKK